MAELADAPDLGSGVPDVQVQALLPVPCADVAERQTRWFQNPLPVMACGFKSRYQYQFGRVPEWSKGADCKSVASASVVRIHSLPPNGQVSERFKELVLKTSGLRGSVGSNPTLSAIFLWIKMAFSTMCKLVVNQHRDCVYSVVGLDGYVFYGCCLWGAILAGKGTKSPTVGSIA